MAAGGKISKKQAREWVARYRKENEGNPKVLYSETFDKDLIQELLNEPGCAGIRIYNSIDDEGKLQLILVGVDSNGKNILPSNEESTSEAEILLEFGKRCPPYCVDEDSL
ncbi:MAG: hypothetical protein O9302_14770 [Cyclobacteriaceae bacterium]|jgi:hypothetical protein|nr:hypothetical protein [Cytophagales bacterium]MCZ8329325.1 hypothetical protein [Cyclobacteriaceae bacterium]